MKGSSSGEHHEGQLDHHPSADVVEGTCETAITASECDRVDPERPVLGARCRHDREHEQHQRDDLALRRQPVDDRVPVVVQSVPVSGTHVAVSSRRTAAAPDQIRGPAGDQEHDADAEDAGQARRSGARCRRLSWSSRPAASRRSRSPSPCRRAHVGGDLVEPVGTPGRVEADDPGQDERHEQGGDHEQPWSTVLRLATRAGGRHS